MTSPGPAWLVSFDANPVDVLNLPYRQIFKIRNTDLQFLSPKYGRQKNEKKKKTGNRKAFCVSHKRNKNNKTIETNNENKPHLMRCYPPIKIYSHISTNVFNEPLNFQVLMIIYFNHISRSNTNLKNSVKW